MHDGALYDALEAQGRLGIYLVLPGNDGRVVADKVLQVAAQIIDIAGAGSENFSRRGVVQQREQQVLDGDEFMTLLPGREKLQTCSTFVTAMSLG